MKSSDDSWQEVMGRLMYFVYTVLPAASRHANWTKQCVDRALSWAQYCEKAVAHIKYRGSLRTALNTLVRKTQHIASFRDLLRATHVLLKLLLQNQLLENSVREHVRAVSLRAQGAEFVSHAELAAQQQQQHAKALLTALTKAQHSSISLRLRARLMLEAANNAEPKQVGVCLAKVAHSPASLQASFLATLLDEKDASVKVGPAVVEWMQGVMASPQHQQYRRVLGCLCSLPPHHLAKVLAIHPLLVRPILECVHREALNLEPYYDREKCWWQPRGPSILSWEDLVRTCAVLINHQRMGAYVMEVIEGWRMLEGGAVLGDIVKQTKASSMPSSVSTSDTKA